MTQGIHPPLALEAHRVEAVLQAGERPYVSLKAAITLDGKIASRHGESQWITGEAARVAGRSLRAQHAGILVGINTVLADDPRLTVRGDPEMRNPVRIVLDSRGRIPLDARCLADDGSRRIVVVGSQIPEQNVMNLEAQGVQVLRCPSVRPAPGEFLPQLRSQGVETLLVEGGSRVHADLIAHRAADTLFLFVAGRVMGDAAAPAWCATLPGENRLADAPALTMASPLTIGGDLLLCGHFSTS